MIELIKTKSILMKRFFECTPHGGEILMKMQEGKGEFCRRFADAEKKILERVIRQGIEEGAFYVEDPARTAAAYHGAFTSYYPPHCIGKTIDEINRGIEDLSDLLIKGLRVART